VKRKKKAVESCFEFNCILNANLVGPTRNKMRFGALPNVCFVVVASNAEATTQTKGLVESHTSHYYLPSNLILLLH